MEDQIYENRSFRIVVPNIEPYFYVKNNKIFSRFNKLGDVLDSIPKSSIFIPHNGYEVGVADDNGTYSGLLGYVQRGDADSMFQPYPLDMDFYNDFQFSYPLYESGFSTISLIYFPAKRFNDLSRSLFDFDFVFASIITLFCICLIIFFCFTQNLNLGESALIIYRITFKEHNLKIKNLAYRHILVFILLYNLFLIILVEQSVNTNLVVLQNPEYIDTIDTIYRKKSLMVHFLKAHYTLSYFKNHNGNIKLKEIYERSTKICKNCLHDQADYLPFLYNQDKTNILLRIQNHIAIGEEFSTIIMRKAVCNLNHKIIVESGVARISAFIAKQLLCFIFRKQIPKEVIKKFDKRTMRFVESGLAIRVYHNAKGTVFGFLTNFSPTYKICKTRNAISLVTSEDNHSFMAIKLENIYFVFYIAGLYFILIFTLIIHFLILFIIYLIKEW